MIGNASERIREDQEREKECATKKKCGTSLQLATASDDESQHVEPMGRQDNHFLLTSSQNLDRKNEIEGSQTRVLLSPAREEIKLKLVEKLTRIKNEHAEAVTGLAATQRKRLHYGNLLANLQSNQDLLRDKIRLVDQKMAILQETYAETSAESDVLRSRAADEAKIVHRKRARVKELESQLHKITIQLHNEELEYEQRLRELASTQRGAWHFDEAITKRHLHKQALKLLGDTLDANLKRIRECIGTDNDRAECIRGARHSMSLMMMTIRTAESCNRADIQHLGKIWSQDLQKLRQINQKIEILSKQVEETEEKKAGVEMHVLRLGKDAIRAAHSNKMRAYKVRSQLDTHKKLDFRKIELSDRLQEIETAQQGANEALKAALSELNHHKKTNQDISENIAKLMKKSHEVQNMIDDIHVKLEREMKVNHENDVEVSRMQREIRKTKNCIHLKSKELAAIILSIHELSIKLDTEQARRTVVDLRFEESRRASQRAQHRLVDVRKEIETILKTIDHKTREMQVLNKKMATIEDQRGDCFKDCGSDLALEVARLKQEIQKILQENQSWHSQWIETHESLCHMMQRLLTSKHACQDQIDVLAKLGQQRDESCSQTAYIETKTHALEIMFKKIQGDLDRLDTTMLEASKLTLKASSDVMQEETRYEARIAELKAMCNSQETKIVQTLQQYQRTRQECQNMCLKLQGIAEQTAILGKQFDAMRQLTRGHNQQYNALKIEALHLGKKLLQAQSRKKKAAIKLLNATAKKL